MPYQEAPTRRPADDARPRRNPHRRSPLARLARRGLWSALAGAEAAEGLLRRAAGGPGAGKRRADCSRGRFAGPCAVNVPQEVRAPSRRRRSRRRAARQRLALVACITTIGLAGALIGSRGGAKGRRHATVGQAAVAGPVAPAPGRITAAERAALVRCLRAEKQPRRPDSMSAERRTAAEAGLHPWVLRRVPTTQKVVTLTFDDGPNPQTTPRVLEALRREGVKATFFLIGAHLEQHPDLARQELAEGHALGNHTWHHFFLDRMDAECTASEMEITSRLIETTTGQHPTWFRPPGGYYSEDVLRTSHQLNQRVVLWSGDARDWAKPSPEVIRSRTLAALKPGAILLLHDSSPHTAAALPELLRQIKGRGYRFATLEELAALPAGDGERPARLAGVAR